MPRISRKHISQATPEFKQIKSYKAAGYVRISSGQRYTTDSSIESQKLLIERRVDDLDDVSLVRFFVDENVSGSTFQRPAFQKMLAEIENGAIDCVIVKDLSRLGRNAIDTTEFLQRYFPSRNVRFITILDAFDTTDGIINKLSEQANTMRIEVVNFANEKIAKDISKNT